MILTTSPASTLSAAFWIVLNGLDSDPGLLSLPVGET